MEFKGRSTDPFEQLITETLDEQLGSPPSAEVWKRIAEEISQPPPDLNQRGRFTSVLSHYPMVRSAFIVIFLLMLVAPPLFQQWNQPSSLLPQVVPTKLPYSLPLRPVPESDLRPTEKQAIPKAQTLIEQEQEQPAQLGTWGLGARGEVIFSSVIEAKSVIEAPNQNHLLGSELDKIHFKSYVGEKEEKAPHQHRQPARRPKPQPDNKHTAA